MKTSRLFWRKGLLIIALVEVAVFLLVARTAFSFDEPEKFIKSTEKTTRNQTYDYQESIQPILNTKCVACHSCNDAPCQLKLESGLGLARGATKLRVYDGTRITDMNPTRLGVDADSISEWREKGFYSVLQPVKDSKASILQRLIAQGMAFPVSNDEPLPGGIIDVIHEQHSCPNPNEIEKAQKDNQLLSMPYGVTGLSDREFATLNTWLSEGAVISPPKLVLADNIKASIEKWEAFLNDRDYRHQLVARYLYEHLFLAHLYFSDLKLDKPYFFKLVRSYTPSPKLVDPVATVRPNGDPGKTFYYRLIPITEAIVHKTHITYPLSESRMDRFKELFFTSSWQVASLPGYGEDFASNPFLTFSAIPAVARYQFMLDDAEYFTRTFIRGPVCRGQIATDVIRDQFWVMFEDPQVDQFVSNGAYENSVVPYLGLPGEKTDLLALAPALLKYHKKRNDYLDKRHEQYVKAFPDGPRLGHIWDGDGHNNNAFLTVFRHHNSASVTKGWKGQYPLTLWVLDYPLFERTYYELVVGFNVYGSISHQAQTRLYFDLIRNGGEVNFLRFMPPSKRQEIYDSWYQGIAKLKQGLVYRKLDSEDPTSISYVDDGSPKHQFIRLMQQRHKRILPVDYLNQCATTNCKGMPRSQTLTNIDKMISELSMTDTSQNPGILQLPEVTVVRVDDDTDYYIYSLLRNRAHSNVAFMLGEELRYQESLDTTTVLNWPISSYPNFMFRVESKELPLFVDLVKNMADEQSKKALIDRWGVRRNHSNFWDLFHSQTLHEDAKRPFNSGIYDLNRYRAW